MSSSGWVSKEAAIAEALDRCRVRRMCVTAKTKLGVELLERRVASGSLLSPFPHLYEEPSLWHSLPLTERALRVIRSAALLHPEWVFCHTSAAIVHGLQVSQPQVGVVHVVTTPRSHTASSRYVIRHAMSAPETCTTEGVHIVSMVPCVLGCLEGLDLPHGLAVADSFLREKKKSTDDLVRLAEGIPCSRKRCHALATAHLANPLAENGGESMARGVMHELGYRTPELQVEFGNPLDQKHPYRVDFLWRGEDATPLIIGELDGRDKYQSSEMLQGRTTLQALTDERLRESRLTATGAKVMRFHFADVLDHRRFDQLMRTFGVPKAG